MKFVNMQLPEMDGLAQGLYRMFNGWLARRRAISELQKLNDHYLRDIGIERYEIEAVVNERWRSMQDSAVMPPTNLRPTSVGRVTKLGRRAANDGHSESAA